MEVSRTGENWSSYCVRERLSIVSIRARLIPIGYCLSYWRIEVLPSEKFSTNSKTNMKSCFG